MWLAVAETSEHSFTLSLVPCPPAEVQVSFSVAVGEQQSGGGSQGLLGRKGKDGHPWSSGRTVPVACLVAVLARGTLDQLGCLT